MKRAVMVSNGVIKCKDNPDSGDTEIIRGT